MTWYIPDVIIEAARALRKDMTSAEKVVWEKIKGRKIWTKFLRQKPLFLYEEIKWFPRYCIPDFCSLEKRIIIEVDGNIHEKEEIYNLDKEKEFLLHEKWYKIIRVKNDEIYGNIDIVINKIIASFP